MHIYKLIPIIPDNAPTIKASTTLLIPSAPTAIEFPEIIDTTYNTHKYKRVTKIPISHPLRPIFLTA